MPETEEKVIKRIMPNSAGAEQSVISAMMMDSDAITTASEILTGDDFYNKQLGILFETMVEMQNAAIPVDPVTLQDKLKEREASPEICSMDFLMNLMAVEVVSTFVREHANIVKEKAVLRKMIKVNEEIAASCYAEKEKLETILEESERKIFELSQMRSTGDCVPIRQIVYNALDKIDKASKQKGYVTGVATGFIDLDYQTAGMQPSDLVLIAARPSMGKTAFALNIAQHVAFRDKKCVAIFSLEMSKEQLINRMFSLESNVDASKLRTGQLADNEWERLLESADDIARSNLIIDDTPSISVAELRSKCRKFKAERGLSMIIIDYLQLMSGSGKAESHQLEIAEISRGLKAVAREMNVPVLALSQLSRQVEQRPDHRPMLSDLRDSGAIEQDADVVMFIYRDDYYHPDTERKGISEIIIAKQRNGQVGTIELVWLAEYTKFANLDKKRSDHHE